MKTFLWIVAALAAATAASANPSYADVLEKGILGGFRALETATTPQSKLLAWASTVHSALGPVAEAARGSRDFSPSRSQVGPKPWSPVPPNYYAMFPPYVGAVGGNNTATLSFQSRCGRHIAIKVILLAALHLTRQLSVSTTELRELFSTRCGDFCLSFNCYRLVCASILELAARPQVCVYSEDLFLLASINQLKFVSVSKEGMYNTSLPVSNTPVGSAAWAAREGVRVFAFLQDSLTAIVDLVDTISLFVPSETSGPAVPPSSINRTIQFMREYAKNPLPPAVSPGTIANLNPDDIPSGTILAILRFDGLAGLEDWGTGARTDHIAMAFRWSNGTLMVVESTDTTAYWTAPNIQMHTWQEWLPLARAADFNIMLLAPSDETQANFDSVKAQQYIEGTLGLPYGYHNFIFGFMDHVNSQGILENLPYPATWQLFEVLFGVISGFDPAIAEKIWELALNFHGHTNGLNTAQLANHAVESLGISFGELMAIPESDDWVYPDGPSMVCDVYACSIFKHGGVFGPMGDNITCSEFTNSDLYDLAIFTSSYWDGIPACPSSSPGLPFCQLMGSHQLLLNEFNSVTPYSGMFEKCAVLPPDYQRRPDMC